MTDGTCSIAGCDRPAKKRSWCTMHYQRWLSRGDPLWTRSPERRFWASIQRLPDDGCWLLTGYIDPGGYGMFSGKGAHRFALSQALGRPILPGKFALHTCDVRSCVRNEPLGVYEIDGVEFLCHGHLFEGTPADNVNDMRAKGRGASGTRNGAFLHPEFCTRGVDHYRAIVNEDQVRAIRSDYVNGALHRELAAEYGVARITISRIVRRESWKHVA